MNKKIRKKMDVIRQRLQKLHKQLAGAKQQTDDPEEIKRLEEKIAEDEAELEKLKERK